MAVFAFFRVVLVALVLGLVAAQECYYPHGELAPAVEKPCSSAPGSACCPEKWECMDNGLCHYAPENLYGRYSCTDQSWKSPGCPANLCTYGMSATGGESILQCADHDDNWCCNGDGNQVKCCDGIPDPRPFFALQAPNIYGTAGGKTGSSVPTLASITGNALEGSTPATASPRSSTSPSSTLRTSAMTSKPPSSSASPSLSPPTLTPLHTSLPPPTSPPTSSPPPNPAHTPHLPLILSLSLSIPLLLALTLIIIWLLRKRSHMKSHPYDYTPRTNAERFSSAPPYPGSPYAGEEKQLHVQGETGVNDPVSTIPGKAELDSGDVVEGVPYCADSVGAGMRLPIARSMVDVVSRNSEGEGAVMPFCVLGGEVVSGRSTPVGSMFGATTVPGRHLTTGVAEGWIPTSATGGLTSSLVGRSLGSVQEVVELPAERTPNATPTQGRMGAVSPVGMPVGVVEMGVGRGSPV